MIIALVLVSLYAALITVLYIVECLSNWKRCEEEIFESEHLARNAVTGSILELNDHDNTVTLRGKTMSKPEFMEEYGK
jgi:hypothetical protein